MAEVEIRQAVSSDILELIKIDHCVETTHVFQLNTSENFGQYESFLREIHLPRALNLVYPRNPELLIESWTQHTLVLVAKNRATLIGYLVLDENPSLNSATITDLVVNPEMRRKGAATALVHAAQNWERKKGVPRFVFEFPAKNRAALELAKKMKFEFEGFCDNYYASHELVLFYGCRLK